MTRPPRFLTAVDSSTSLPSAKAEPPEALAVESDFVVILAALLCALICVVGLIALARCAWLRRSSAPVNGRSSAQAFANRGLKKKIIQSIPKFTYDSAAKGKFPAECAICLAEYAEGEEIRVLPQCGHGFHVTCVDMWLGSHSSCPSCRQILVVARCRKCGEFPAVSGAGSQPEAEQRARENGSASAFFTTLVL
uniref:Putative RING-H2 finger protein ATL80 n=1 Tax=Davidia involucrata TaxID=16924 RepID=A0A5B7C3I5_DAVIN